MQRWGPLAGRLVHPAGRLVWCMVCGTQAAWQKSAVLLRRSCRRPPGRTADGVRRMVFRRCDEGADDGSPGRGRRRPRSWRSVRRSWNCASRTDDGGGRGLVGAALYFLAHASKHSRDAPVRPDQRHVRPPSGKLLLRSRLRSDRLAQLTLHFSASTSCRWPGRPLGDFRTGLFVKEDAVGESQLRIFWSWFADNKWQAPTYPRRWTLAGQPYFVQALCAAGCHVPFRETGR